jgi:hypothetical protein
LTRQGTENVEGGAERERQAYLDRAERINWGDS